jgi:hypothetical protein
MDLLKQNVELARKFKPMSEQEKKLVLAKTAEVAAEGRSEPFKTTRQFDSPTGRRIHGIPLDAKE